MNDLQAIAYRVQIEALRSEATDAVMMRDYDRGASLFTEDCVVRIPRIGVELTGLQQTTRSGSSGGTDRPVIHVRKTDAASAGLNHDRGRVRTGRSFAVDIAALQPTGANPPPTLMQHFTTGRPQGVQAGPGSLSRRVP